MLIAYAYAYVAFAFGVVLIAVLSLMRRQDAVGLSFFCFSLPVAVWALFISFWITQQHSYEVTLFLSRICNSAALFIPVTWIHFISLYTKRVTKIKTLLFFFYGVTVILFFFAPMSPLFVSGLHPVGEFKYYTSPGPLYLVFTLMFFCVFPYGFYLLHSAYVESSEDEKQRIKYVITAVLLGFFAGGSTFLPVYGLASSTHAVLLMPLYPFLMGAALMRYGLFNEQALAQAAHRDKLAAIGTLSASINHEIRNPLYIIHGLSESYLHRFQSGDAELSILKQESVSAFEKAAQQAKRAMEIMSQLSMFAKQQTVAGVLEMEKTNLQACLDNVLPLVRHEMTLDKVAFESCFSSDLPNVKANPRQIEEVLFNLLVNSCQALKKESGNIKVTAKCVAEKVIMAIEDNGPGISSAQLKKIFEPFYTTKEEGTGLGLYIVKQLVEKNGGRISVESKEGNGTRFLLEFIC